METDNKKLEPAKIGYLVKDRKEKFSAKRNRAWFVNAWHIVDINNKDYFQPWVSTKGEALKLAKEMNITISENSGKA